ncbi:MAG: endonuclease/exonuclease/phosphatase family protein [Alphaproteobacteria bacterium]
MLFVSYNIRYGLGQDGRYDLARAVAAVDEADVIAFQEVEVNWPRTGMVDQPRAIGELLPRHHWVYGPAFDVDAGTADGSGRVTNRRRQFGTMLASRTPILSSRLLGLPKVATLDVFNLVNPALEGVIATASGAVRVLSLHLSHLTEEERLMQVEAVLAWHGAAAAEGGAWTGRDEPDIEAWSEGDPPPMPAEALLMGDFNSEPDGRVYPRLTVRAGFVDTWRAAGRGSEPCLTWTPYAHARVRHDRRLDYAFATPSLAARVRRAWVDRDAKGSDHYPYWVEIAV